MKNEENNMGKELESSVENRVRGWHMTPDETKSFFKGLGKKVITFVGYSSGYEDEKEMLRTVKTVLSGYSPKLWIVNIGATTGGIGGAYPTAKSMGFTTTGIVSTLAIEYIEYISTAVDHICFIKDDLWGGKIPGSDELSPTSQAMVMCSDILIGIGGNEIGRDELLAGKEQGKTVNYYPAEIHHEYLINRAKKLNLPPPKSFKGAAHEEFANQT